MDFLAHKTPSYVKQNIDESHSKQTKIHRKIQNSLPASGFYKSQEKKSANKKSQDFCQKFVIYKKKTITKGRDLKSIENLV
jgi:hypothetical protein